MPGGLTLLASANGDIPTPAAGKATIFFSLTSGVPSYKNDAGVVTALGTTGATGPAGSAGPVGPIFIGADGLDGSDGISVPGVSGGSTPGASGALVLLEQHTASSSAELDFTTCITSTYDEYIIELINVIPANAAVALNLQVSVDAGATYNAGANYYTATRIEPNSGGSALSQTNAAAQAEIFGGVDNTVSSGGLSGRITLYNPLSATIRKQLMYQAIGSRASDVCAVSGMAVWNLATAVNAFRILFSAGNIAQGTIRVYGVAKT